MKTLLKLKAKYPEIIADLIDETGEDNGYWIYLKSGYVCPEMECGIIHERTIRECAKLFKTVTLENQNHV